MRDIFSTLNQTLHKKNLSITNTNITNINIINTLYFLILIHSPNKPKFIAPMAQLSYKSLHHN